MHLEKGEHPLPLSEKLWPWPCEKWEQVLTKVARVRRQRCWQRCRWWGDKGVDKGGESETTKMLTKVPMMRRHRRRHKSSCYADFSRVCAERAISGKQHKMWKLAIVVMAARDQILTDSSTSEGIITKNGFCCCFLKGSKLGRAHMKTQLQP